MDNETQNGGTFFRVIVGLGISLLGFGQLVLAGIGVASYLNSKQPNASPPLRSNAHVGDLEAVTLVSGRTVFGTLATTDSANVVLNDVYLIKSFPAPKPPNSPPSPPSATPEMIQKLVRVESAELYQPSWMEIPVDKVLSIEPVGQNSKIAQLIAQASGR